VRDRRVAAARHGESKRRAAAIAFQLVGVCRSNADLRVVVVDQPVSVAVPKVPPPVGPDSVTMNVSSGSTQGRGLRTSLTAHLSMVAVELLGVGITPRHHRRPLGDADVGLPQLHPVPAGQSIEALDRSVEKLGIGREGDVLGLHLVSTV
jgi:hypothetical protein